MLGWLRLPVSSFWGSMFHSNSHKPNKFPHDSHLSVQPCFSPRCTPLGAIRCLSYPAISDFSEYQSDPISRSDPMSFLTISSPHPRPCRTLNHSRVSPCPKCQIHFRLLTIKVDRVWCVTTPPVSLSPNLKFPNLIGSRGDANPQRPS